ncbi:MAG TPA: NAD(P)/FAD-dependent oxidoreductase [Roseiflexaceae bacterium]|nr:NAD(P)/FAD-dependent oxidoreductase [Roseiflexaceae bacterium]
MIIVVGAGPAGLAVARELGRRGLACRVLERHTIGHSWGQHYDGLRLHTLKQVSALPGLPMPAGFPDFPTAEQLRDYLRDYARLFQVDITEEAEVRCATPSAAGWRLETSAGAVEAEWLVAATGIWSKPFCPQLPGHEQFGGAVIHSSEYRNAAPYRGRRVLVVGAGNSGAEIALDLCAHGVETAISVRSGVAFAGLPRSPARERAVAWLFRSLPRPLGGLLLRRRNFAAQGLPLPAGSLLDAYPVVGYALPEAAARGQVAVYPAVARLLPEGAWFSDGRLADFDAIILATGYRPALDFVAHALHRDERGRPRVDRRWRALGARRLSCVGFRYPATEGWLQGIGRVARQAADGIAERLALAG